MLSLIELIQNISVHCFNYLIRFNYILQLFSMILIQLANASLEFQYCFVCFFFQFITDNTVKGEMHRKRLNFIVQRANEHENNKNDNDNDNNIFEL